MKTLIAFLLISVSLFIQEYINSPNKFIIQNAYYIEENTNFIYVRLLFNDDNRLLKLRHNQCKKSYLTLISTNVEKVDSEDSFVLNISEGSEFLLSDLKSLNFYKKREFCKVKKNRTFTFIIPKYFVNESELKLSYYEYVDKQSILKLEMLRYNWSNLDTINTGLNPKLLINAQGQDYRSF
jgi:hypothetical protein